MHIIHNLLNINFRLKSIDFVLLLQWFIQKTLSHSKSNKTLSIDSVQEYQLYDACDKNKPQSIKCMTLVACEN